MKTYLKIIFVIIFAASVFSNSYSQDLQNRKSNSKNGTDLAPTNPLYQLRAANITSGVDAPTGNNAIFFDIYIYHTNPQTSGPFEYSAGQFYLGFNSNIANGGTLTYSIIPNSTQFSNPNAAPVNPAVIGNILRLERNTPLIPGNAPFVSDIFPGTRVISVKLVTTAPTIDINNLQLTWLRGTQGNDGLTEVYAFVDGVSTNISDSGTYIIDSTDVPLPVELLGFTSAINRNNVLLNWFTTSEINNYGFDIERNYENNVWEKVGFLKGYGNSNSPISYSFEDRNLVSGRYNYRLKQIDINGNYEYFNLLNEVNIGTPVIFTLKQNYPNPFNPATKIDYVIPSSSFVSLKVYDVNGREVKTLVNEFKNPGYYTFDFNASALPSGVYYYILKSGNFSSTKKLILMK